MAPKSSKRLVIDASVARASGEGAHDVSIRCRELLVRVMEVCHRLVLTDEIEEEWTEHQSGFARKWRRSMHARRKVAKPDAQAIDDKLTKKILQTAEKDVDAATMEKDLRLLDAALATDSVVISLDEESRTLFDTAAARVGELRRVAWGNPSIENEDVVTWLEKGATLEKRRRLGQSRRE